MFSKKYTTNQIAFNTLVVLREIFEYVCHPDTLMSSFQHLNKRFYNNLLPRMLSNITLYKSNTNRMSISIIDQKLVHVSRFSKLSHKFTYHEINIFADDVDSQSALNILNEALVLDCCQLDDDRVALLLSAKKGTIINHIAVWSLKSNR